MGKGVGVIWGVIGLRSKGVWRGYLRVYSEQSCYIPARQGIPHRRMPKLAWVI